MCPFVYIPVISCNIVMARDLLSSRARIVQCVVDNICQRLTFQYISAGVKPSSARYHIRSRFEPNLLLFGRINSAGDHVCDFGCWILVIQYVGKAL